MELSTWQAARQHPAAEAFRLARVQTCSQMFMKRVLFDSLLKASL